jgi:hypothetical protein
MPRILQSDDILMTDTRRQLANSCSSGIAGLDMLIPLSPWRKGHQNTAEGKLWEAGSRLAKRLGWPTRNQPGSGSCNYLVNGREGWLSTDFYIQV